MKFSKFINSGCAIHDEQGRFIAQVMADEFADLDDCAAMLENEECLPCCDALKAAKLIASGPELLAKLEALTNAASVVNVFLDATPAHRTADIYALRKCIEESRVAIAKAT